jgi:hypothetical protein
LPLDGRITLLMLSCFAPGQSDLREELAWLRQQLSREQRSREEAQIALHHCLVKNALLVSDFVLYRVIELGMEARPRPPCPAWQAP